MSTAPTTTASASQQHSAATITTEQLPPAPALTCSTSSSSALDTSRPTTFIAGSPSQRERRRSGSWQLPPHLTVASPSLTATQSHPPFSSPTLVTSGGHTAPSIQSPGSAPVPQLRASQSAAGSATTYHRSTYQKTHHRLTPTQTSSWHSSPLQPTAVSALTRNPRSSAASPAHTPMTSAATMPPSASAAAIGPYVSYHQQPTQWAEPFAGLSLHARSMATTTQAAPMYVTVPAHHLAYPYPPTPIYTHPPPPPPANTPPQAAAPVQHTVTMQEWITMFTQFSVEMRMQSLLQIVNVCTGAETAQLAALLIDKMNAESASRGLSSTASRQQSPPSPAAQTSAATATSTAPRSVSAMPSVGGFAVPSQSSQSQSQLVQSLKPLAVSTQPSTPTHTAAADQSTTLTAPTSQPASPTRLVKPHAKRNSSEAGLQPSTPSSVHSRSPSPRNPKSTTTGT